MEINQDVDSSNDELNEQYGNKRTNKHYQLNSLIIKKLSVIDKNSSNQIFERDHTRFMDTLNQAIETDNMGLI